MRIYRALKINPKFAEVYFNQGFAYLNKDLYNQAISDFNKALEINPKFARAYYDKAVSCKKAGRNQEAVESYKRFIQYAPSEGASLIELAKQSIRELER